MITNQRYERILDYLNVHGTGSVNDLVKITDSSTATVRRDLTHLESEGILKRVHGGATLGGLQKEEDYSDKSVKNLTEKIKIAQNAAAMIENGDTVFIDAGTTTYEMMPFIRASDITVVTNNVTLIEQLVKNGYQTHVLGGKVKPATKAVVGVDVVEKLKALSFDKCFVGVNAIDLNHGFSTPDDDEALIKKTALSQSRYSYVLSDSSKFERSAFVKFADLEAAVIITETEKHPFIQQLNTKTHIIGGGDG